MHEILFGKTAATPELIEWKLNDLGIKYEKKHVERILWAVVNEIDSRAKRGEDRFLVEQEFDDLCRRIVRESS